MKTNMGWVDRGVRLVVAAVVAVLFLTKQIHGQVWTILGILTIAVFVVTGIIGICPLYIPFRISTKKKIKPTA